MDKVPCIMTILKNTLVLLNKEFEKDLGYTILVMEDTGKGNGQTIIKTEKENMYMVIKINKDTGRMGKKYNLQSESIKITSL